MPLKKRLQNKPFALFLLLTLPFWIIVNFFVYVSISLIGSVWSTIDDAKLIINDCLEILRKGKE